MLTVRKAVAADAANVSLLGKMTFKATFEGDFVSEQTLKRYLAETFRLSKIEESLQKANNRYWVALHDDLHIGYAKLKVHSTLPQLPQEGICQLQKIYVLEDYFYTRVGQRLLDAVIEEARALGKTWMWLVVLHSNGRAVRFYEKNGFEAVGPHQHNIEKQTFEFLLMLRSL